MARAYLLSAAPDDPVRFPKAFLDLEQLRTCARVDRFGVHSTVDDPEAADIVLFVEVSGNAGHYFERVRRHPIRRAFRSKSFLFCSTDRVVPLLPGIYASLERSWYSAQWARAGHYLGVRERGALRYREGPAAHSHLFSFVGATSTHGIRRSIMGLRHPDALLIDTSDPLERIGLEPDEFQRRYAQSISDSAFVLCPRGGGTATFRLFETMMLGRAPVIISDEWVPPEGPDWRRFSIRVPEGEVGGIPALLAEREAEAAAMGAAAREAWTDWFSEFASFHRIVEWCLQLEGTAHARHGFRRFAPYRQMARPYHAARWVAKRLGR